jgi:hypothetical protein
MGQTRDFFLKKPGWLAGDNLLWMEVITLRVNYHCTPNTGEMSEYSIRYSSCLSFSKEKRERKEPQHLLVTCV